MTRKPRRIVTSGAPPRSLYRKIQIVLAEVRRTKATSLEKLVEQIYGRGHLDFTRYQADVDHSTSLVPCSAESIERVITVCEELGLLNIAKLELTRSGLKALDGRSFDEVVRKSVPLVLSSRGAPMETIKAAIIELLTSRSENSLPTAEAIYEKLGNPGGNSGRNEFKTYLSLLAAARGLSFSRKKIYLP